MQPTLPDTATVPAVLRDVDQWVCWRTRDRGDEKPTKVPIDPATGSFASTTDADTWASYETAHTAARQRGAAGLGFVFTADDAFVGVDLDHCRDPESGRFEPWAAEVIGQLDSYTEVSPSGTGCHVLCRGTMPTGRNRSGDVEMYTESRFFTVTGDHVAGTPLTVNHRTAVIGAVATEYLAASETPSETTPDPESVTSSASTDTTLSDEDLLERAKAAANGEKFTRLWNGETSQYKSHSEADMALCCLLAFWSGGDAHRMNRLFCRSGLYRDKWDETHFADGSTYGERTIQRACERTTDHYTPSASSTSRDAGSTPSKSAPRTSQTRTPAPAENTLRRLTTTEETLEYLEERVNTLEKECAQLRDELTDARQPATHDQQIDAEAGVLARVGRLFR
jgi:primase-polymerase (primpol)-like protein